MTTKTIGLFYNPQFDTLIASICQVDQKVIKTIANWTFILDNNQHLVGFNLKSPNQELKTKLTPGINSDNSDLIKELSSLLKPFNYDLENFNQTPQFVVAKILERSSHPNSEKLSICQVQIGANSINQIVCGADNCDANNLVVVATVGAIMPNLLKIIPSELRGEISNGMICSERELGLEVTFLGKTIMVLRAKKYQIGNGFWREYYNNE